MAKKKIQKPKNKVGEGLKGEKAPLKSASLSSNGGESTLTKKPKSAKRSGKKGEKIGSDSFKQRENVRRLKLEKTAAVQDVGFPVDRASKKTFAELISRGPEDPGRRSRSLESFRVFCETYGGPAFRIAWAPYHLKAIEKIEDAVRTGANFAFAMPRGSGKSTLCHWAIIWATLSGLCPYALYVGATAKSAESRLANIKRTLRFSDLLFADFPEALAAVRHCAGEPRRATGQKYQGRSTGLEWTDRIVLPDIPGSLSCNFVIDCASIDGEIRGRLYEKQNGETIRPRLVVCDDPQTRETAKSRTLSDYREAIIKGDLKYLAGPGARLGLVVPCTVIYRDDLAYRLLDRKRNPEFKGESWKMLEGEPEAPELWAQYDELRKFDLRAGGSGAPASAFYRDNRDRMDRGLSATWPERFSEGLESAIEEAMRLRLEDESAFFAECQNEPLVATDETEERPLLSSEIESRILPIDWGVAPDDSEKITAFVDVSERVLWFAVVAWRRDGSGTVVRYGSYPDQGLGAFTLATARRTLLSEAGKGKSFLSALLEGLENLVRLIGEADYQTETGEDLTLAGIGIDSGWGEYAADVYRFCRRSSFRSILKPTKGVGITAKRRPLVDPEKKIKSRESIEGQWFFSKTKLGVPLLQFDANLWKGRIQSGFSLDLNSSGALSFTRPRKGAGAVHKMFSDQITAERGERVTTNGRTVTEFRELPGRDNHFLDCMVGAAVVANTVGIRFDFGASARRARSQAISDKREKEQQARKAFKSRPRSSVSF